MVTKLGPLRKVTAISFDEKLTVIGSFVGYLQKAFFSSPMKIGRLMNRILNLLFRNDISEFCITDGVVYVGVVL